MPIRCATRLAGGQSRDQIVGDILAIVSDPVEANTFFDVSQRQPLPVDRLPQ